MIADLYMLLNENILIDLWSQVHNRKGLWMQTDLFSETHLHLYTVWINGLRLDGRLCPGNNIKQVLGMQNSPVLWNTTCGEQGTGIMKHRCPDEVITSMMRSSKLRQSVYIRHSISINVQNQ